MKDFLSFRKMISPLLIQLGFWLALVFFVYTAIIDIVHHENWWLVFQLLVLGPLAARVLCELLLLFFRIQSDVQHISSHLNNQ